MQVQLTSAGQQSMKNFNHVLHMLQLKCYQGTFLTHYSSRNYVVESVDVNIHTVLPNHF